MINKMNMNDLKKSVYKTVGLGLAVTAVILGSIAYVADKRYFDKTDLQQDGIENRATVLDVNNDGIDDYILDDEMFLSNSNNSSYKRHNKESYLSRLEWEINFMETGNSIPNQKSAQSTTVSDSLRSVYNLIRGE
jgi:hypothetical protein